MHPEPTDPHTRALLDWLAALQTDTERIMHLTPRALESTERVLAAARLSLTDRPPLCSGEVRDTDWDR